MTFITAKKSLAAAGFVSLMLLAGAGESQAQREGRDVETVKGRVRSFTEAPKGEKDGMVLSDGTVVHWPPHLADRFTAVAKKGDRVEVAGRYETLKEGEKVFEARTVTNVASGASFTNDDDGPPPKDRKDRKGKKGKDDFKGKDRVAGPDRTVTGTVRRLTTAPKGEVDGAELSDGTVVHWPPHMADRFTAVVKKGDRLRVVGWDETLRGGDQVLEVRTVTNLATNTSRSNDDAPAPRAGGRRPADLEGRVQALEDKMDTLIEELRRSRREKLKAPRQE